MPMPCPYRDTESTGNTLRFVRWKPIPQDKTPVLGSDWWHVVIMHLKRGGSDKAFVTNAIANLHHHHWSYLSIQFRLRWYSHGLKLMRHYRLRNSRESYDGNQVKFCRSQMHLKFCNRTRWRRVASRRVAWDGSHEKKIFTPTLILISHSYSNRIRIIESTTPESE